MNPHSDIVCSRALEQSKFERQRGLLGSLASASQQDATVENNRSACVDEPWKAYHANLFGLNIACQMVSSELLRLLWVALAGDRTLALEQTMRCLCEAAWLSTVSARAVLAVEAAEMAVARKFACPGPVSKVRSSRSRSIVA